MLQGWRLLWGTAIVSTVMLGLIWQIDGLTEASVRIAVRGTARFSCLLFLLAFVAAPLHRLWATNFSRWLLQNRRFLGLSMAVSHLYHGVALVGLHLVTQGQHPQILPLAVLGYVFLTAMAATSFQPTAKAIGRRAWRILHTAGMHYFWLAFALEYVFRAFQNWIYFVLALLVLAGMAIRLWPKPKVTTLLTP
jgi:methionine sulfoxide reductase heme-binding subunit